MVAIHGEHRHIERDERRGISFVLAALVHVGLGLLLLISVQWRTQRVQTVEVEMWGNPPPAPAPEVQVEAKVEPVQPVAMPEPVPEVKPEIVEEKIKPVVKPVKKPPPEPVITSPKPPKKVELSSLEKMLQQGVDARNKAPATSPVSTGKSAAKAVGTGTNANALSTTTAKAGSGGEGTPGKDYAGLVVRVIKSNLVYPENKREDPKAKIRVSLLPDGSIRDAKVVKAVGDPTYADAALRAVMTTQRFPPQPDGKPFSGEWREWTLNFCARENVECKID